MMDFLHTVTNILCYALMVVFVVVLVAWFVGGLDNHE